MKYRALLFVFLFSLPLVSQADIVRRESTVEEAVRATFWNNSVMIEIARCESGMKQFELNGFVRQGRVNPKDKGVFQINEKFHLANANQLGYDIYTISGNIQMAKHIYEQSGTKPWDSSKSCWSKTS